MGTQKNRLTETILLSTHNIGLAGQIRILEHLELWNQSIVWGVDGEYVCCRYETVPKHTIYIYNKSALTALKKRTRGH